MKGHLEDYMVTDEVVVRTGTLHLQDSWPEDRTPELLSPSSRHTALAFPYVSPVTTYDRAQPDRVFFELPVLSVPSSVSRSICRLLVRLSDHFAKLCAALSARDRGAFQASSAQTMEDTLRYLDKKYGGIGPYLHYIGITAKEARSAFVSGFWVKRQGGCIAPARSPAEPQGFK